MARDELAVLAAFAVVAEELSFTKAAHRLGLSRSAVSHAIRSLEERLGLRLLARTTRTVAPTEAGERLLAHVRPALEEIEAALAEAGRLRARRAGVVRLVAPPMAIAMALWPKVAKFVRDNPEVVLDITTEGENRPDLVAGRFDAGIHLGEFVQRDMVAVRISGEQRAAVVGAPAYFDSHPRPKTPRDLTAHSCISHRLGVSGPVYRWEFEKRGRPVVVSVSGPLVVTDPVFTLRAALDGLGLAYLLEEDAADLLGRGDLVRVLEDWCPPFDGYFLYYPSRRHQPPALQALVEALRV
ncbi:MAG: LysR family transcriptional regulator [Holophagales bacterium]|nr:LysR family transcriptional regulator [Holophagales bacterium]